MYACIQFSEVGVAFTRKKVAEEPQKGFVAT